MNARNDRDCAKKRTYGVRKLARAHILLHADEGKKDKEIAAALHVGRATVERIRKRFVEGNVARALSEDPRPGKAPKLDAKGEAIESPRRAVRRRWDEPPGLCNY